LERKTNLQRMGAICGVTAPVLAFSCILLAIYSYPPFSWTENALSDLGVVPGMTGLVFNFGLYASGFFVFIFAVFGLFNYLGQRWIGKIAAVAFAAVGLALIGIGFFPETVVPAHYLFSVAFFLFMPISLLIVTVAFAIMHQPKMAAFTLLIAVAAALPWVLLFTLHYVSGVAIPEFLSALAGSAWSVLLSYKMFKGASQSNS
jgi:hypothetical membrane protein